MCLQLKRFFRSFLARSVSTEKMDEGEQSDDSSGSESELQQQAEQLQAVVSDGWYSI